MNTSKYKHWQTALKSERKKPVYLLIPDIISDDIDNGILTPQERLPTIRELAKFLSLDYTTIVRAYKEARHQGLIESHPRSGSFVKGRMRTLKLNDDGNFEMTLNSPPEHTSVILKKIELSIKSFNEKHDVNAMLRYQDFGGSDSDKQAGVTFLSSVIEQLKTDQLLVCPSIRINCLRAKLDLSWNESDSLTTWS